ATAREARAPSGGRSREGRAHGGGCDRRARGGRRRGERAAARARAGARVVDALLVRLKAAARGTTRSVPNDELIILDGCTFFYSDENGDVDAKGPEGFFYHDVRHLSRWVTRVNGAELDPL